MWFQSLLEARRDSRSLGFDKPFDVAASMHQGGLRPFEPRKFGRREFEKRDVYGYLSVKEGRPVEVEGLPGVAVGLTLEVFPQFCSYVERPRSMIVGDKKVELHFWLRHAAGFEEFILLVPDAQCVQAAGGTLRPREADRLLAAARDAGIALRFVTETDIRTAGATIAQHNRLLAFAQVAQSLDSRLALRSRILEHFDLQPRARIDQVEAALSPCLPADVQAVLCELICLGALDFDRGHELTRHTLIERRKTS
ncbi:MAG: hypothetical protein JSR26_05195 [Proteobacteria bacterium]|nr:hypothetical protein [Pseudomonadota bacterium]